MFIRITLILFIAFSINGCRKDEHYAFSEDTAVNSYVIQAKQWLADSGQVFSKEILRLQKDGQLNEYLLNWREAKNYSYKGWDYLRVPFGSFSDSSLGLGYHIVFRKKEGDGRILANYKQYVQLQKATDAAIGFYAENIYGMDGQLILSVGHEAGNRWKIDTTRLKKSSGIPGLLSSNCTINGFTYTITTCVTSSGDGGNMNAVCTFSTYGSYTVSCTSGNTGGNEEVIDWIDPGDGGGGMYDPPPPPPDPCAEAQPAATGTASLTQTQLFSNAKTEIQNAYSADGQEHSKTFGSSGGTLTAAPIENGTNGASAPVNISWPGAFADLHNHPNNFAPSAGDMYTLIGVNNGHVGYNTRMVLTSDGSIYALVVINLAAANAFVAAHPSVNSANGPDFSQSIYEEFDKARNYTYLGGASELEADAFGMAYVLEKYNTGVVLLKQDNDGTFKMQRVQRVLNNGTEVFNSNNCP